MTETLKSRKTAAVVLVIVILIATPLGSARSIRKEASKVEDMFYNGVYVKDGNYTSGAISDYLSDASRAAIGLVSVASNYDNLSDETESLRSAREELIDAVDISAMYTANSKMQSAWENLYGLIQSENLSDSEKDSIEDYASLFEGAEGAVKKNGYNDAVSEFNDEILGRVPANVIAGIMGVDGPESFG
jgi:hypothetical protein